MHTLTLGKWSIYFSKILFNKFELFYILLQNIRQLWFLLCLIVQTAVRCLNLVLFRNFWNVNTFSGHSVQLHNWNESSSYIHLFTTSFRYSTRRWLFQNKVFVSQSMIYVIEQCVYPFIVSIYVFCAPGINYFILCISIKTIAFATHMRARCSYLFCEPLNQILVYLRCYIVIITNVYNIICIVQCN